MKLPTIVLGGAALVALAACNTEQAANDSAGNAAEAAAGIENVAGGDKPANEAEAGDQTSTGDKPEGESAADAPADQAAAGDEAAGDKPVE